MDIIRDEFIVRNFFFDNESKEYVFGKMDKYYRGEWFFKFFIKRKRCKEFVVYLYDLFFYKYVFEKILKF